MIGQRRRWWLLPVAALALGGTLIALADTVTGQHARGNWVQPAKMIGALLIVGGIYLTLWMILIRDRHVERWSRHRSDAFDQNGHP
jgi:hypothetical protein